jgi:hypothetical protein
MFLAWAPDLWKECQFYTQLGFRHGFQPVTFALDPAHLISWDVKGYAIDYAGKRTRVDQPPPGYGTVFLPMRYTPLSAGPLRDTRRHFIERAAWVPNQDQSAWRLSLNLMEVVRDQVLSIASDESVPVPGLAPPTGPQFAVNARVRVNDTGDLEWVVVREGTAHVTPIESLAEREELAKERQERLEQDAAKAKIDWTRRYDVTRSPSLSFAGSEGCGDVFLYGWTAERAEVITIRADKERLQLSVVPRSVDLGTSVGLMDVAIHVYGQPTNSLPFCTDVSLRVPTEEVWRAVGGTATIHLSPPGVRIRAPRSYRATVTISGAEFVSPSGVRVRQVQPITLTAIVGWLAG